MANGAEDMMSTGWLFGKGTGMFCLKCVDSAGKVILKRVFEKYGIKSWTGFSWF